MIILDGKSLTIEKLVKACKGEKLQISSHGRKRMRESSKIVSTALNKRIPVYGVTRGLGARSIERLNENSLSTFSEKTLLGRAQAIGETESYVIIRASLIIRLNTLLLGHTGANETLADHLLSCLNAGLTPEIGKIGSIGPADLIPNASIGLALIGKGRLSDKNESGEASEMLHRNEIQPLKLGPRDGLALASHSGVTVGTITLAHSEIENNFEALQSATCLSLEAFRANLSPIDEKVLAVKPLPGQKEAGKDLRKRLSDSKLWKPEQARRLQDPLSLRNVVQIHGALKLALMHSKEIIDIELNGSSDNPVTLINSGEIVPSGAYYTAELSLVCEGVSRALLSVSMAQISRLAKVLDPRFSELTMGLSPIESQSSGFGPVMKTAEALVAEIAHLSAPPSIWPSIGAYGVEDTMSSGPVAARSLMDIASKSRTLIAIEIMIAVQAIEIRGCKNDMGPFLRKCFETCRSISSPLIEDRPLTEDIKNIEDAILSGCFS